MLGFAGLAVDVSLWYFDKRTALGASDSAAFSAIVTYNADVAAGLSSTNAQTNAVAAAKAVTATYGYANGVNGVTVTVNDPPKSGSHKSPPSGSVAFEVIVTKTEPQFFSGLFVSGVSVTGRSVAEVSTSAAKNGAAGAGCIEQFAASGSVNMSNGVSVTTKSCAIYGNGTGSAALSVTGGANLTVDGINLVGSITQNQGGAINNSGTKLTGQAATPDPYASYTISAAETTAASEASADASAASKAGAGYTPSGSCPNSTPTSFSTGGKTTTIYPGFYCGGLTAGNNNNIIMSPGVYVVVGGQFSMQGGITVTATGGVTVVLTGSGSNYATANIANGVNFNLTAPSTGSTAGLAFYGDPNAPLSNTSSIAGGANMVINGGIYMKSQTIDFSNGTSNAAACTQLIAGSIVFTGGAVFTNNCTSYGTQGIAVTPAATSLAIVE
jgi:hypothetical protein